MALYKRGNSPYWVIQFQLNKKTFIKSSRTTVKKVAERMETEWKAQIHGQKYLGEKEPITLQQMFDRYLKHPFSASTISNVRYLMGRVAKHIDLSQYAHEFNQNEWNKYIDKQRAEGRQESTLDTACLQFRGVWNLPSKEIYNIPELKIATPRREPKPVKYWTPDEKEFFLDWLRSRKSRSPNPGELLDFFTLLFNTGLRFNEGCLLKWSDVDLEARTIEVWRKKNKVASIFHMTNEVHAMLQSRADAKKSREWVFPNGDNTRHRTLDSGFLNETIRKAGIYKTVHQIRHGYSVNMLKNGLSLIAVSKLLGHKNPMTTARFYATWKAPTSAEMQLTFSTRRVLPSVRRRSRRWADTADYQLRCQPIEFRPRHCDGFTAVKCTFGYPANLPGVVTLWAYRGTP